MRIMIYNFLANIIVIITLVQMFRCNLGNSMVEHGDKAPCDYSNCFECTLDTRCGWCNLKGKCTEGDVHGPYSSACSSTWYKNSCPSSCNEYSDCVSCLNDSTCGWCGSECLCIPKKASNSPLFQECNLQWIGSDVNLCPKKNTCDDEDRISNTENVFKPPNVPPKYMCDLKYFEKIDKWECKS